MGDLVLKRQYSADGYAVPAHFVRDDFIFVWGDGRSLSPYEYDIANDGKGGRTLTTKDEFEDVCFAYVPDVGFTLTKLDQSSQSAFNDYFARLEANIKILRWQADKSLGGGVCDDGAPDMLTDLAALKEQIAALSDATDARVIDAENAVAKAIKALAEARQEAIDDPAPVAVEPPKPVRLIPCRSKWRFEELVCGQEYCGAELPIVGEVFEWPATVPDSKMLPVTRLEQKPSPAVLLCKIEPEYEWEATCIEVAAQKKPYHPAKLELST